ncbi:MAG: hypothetical protein ACR2OG_09220 [Gemmatimonadaceae bacterium]
MGALLYGMVFLAACSGTRDVSGPPTQFDFTVQTRSAFADGPAAIALGWPAGVPGATVIAQLINAAGQPLAAADTVVADAAGRAKFVGLATGTYRLLGLRALSAAERTKVRTAGADLVAFVGRVTVTVDSTARQPVLELGGTASGSLLISEIYRDSPPLPSGIFYMFDHYLKVYNNSDTTIALAGKIFFDGFPGWADYRPGNACATWAPYMDDPEGVWAQYIYRFPPNSPPLQAGQAVVLATDAIDHRQVSTVPGYLDLSRAQFEFVGGADVRNPLALPMISIGPRDGGQPFGHGWTSYEIREVIGLAEPLNVDTLPRKSDPPFGSAAFLRIPVGALLDVVTYKSDFRNSSPECPVPVVPAIDAAEAVVGSAVVEALHRRVLFTTLAGHALLLRSHNSAADFEVGPPSPFSVP